MGFERSRVARMPVMALLLLAVACDAFGSATTNGADAGAGPTGPEDASTPSDAGAALEDSGALIGCDAEFCSAFDDPVSSPFGWGVALGQALPTTAGLNGTKALHLLSSSITEPADPTFLAVDLAARERRELALSFKLRIAALPEDHQGYKDVVIARLVCGSIDNPVLVKLKASQQLQVQFGSPNQSTNVVVGNSWLDVVVKWDFAAQTATVSAGGDTSLGVAVSAPAGVCTAAPSVALGFVAFADPRGAPYDLAVDDVRVTSQ